MKIKFLPQNVEIDVKESMTILQAAVLAGVNIDGNCAGKGTCGKCKVKVLKGDKTQCLDFHNRLSESDKIAGYRLACSHSISEGMVVELPESDSTATRKKKLISFPKNFKMKPPISKVCVTVQDTNLAEQESIEKRISNALKNQDICFDSYVLKLLPQALKDCSEITLTMDANRAIDVEKGDTTEQNYGIAVDIGTTTVLVMLWNLTSGSMEAIKGITNPQGAYGADVISRISYIDHDEKKLELLRKAIVDKVNDVIKEFEDTEGIRSENIYSFTVVGNTTMSHIFMGVDPSQLAYLPFAPVYTRSGIEKAQELGFLCHKNALLYRAANIAGHVGSDITAGVITTDIMSSTENHLFIDIGTNGEIVMSAKGKRYTCSTAAGPAFEGSSIKQGMRAARGAIERVNIKKETVETSVIGDVAPIGICGSGIIDAVGELVRSGIVRSDGRFCTEEELTEKGIAENLIKRICQDSGGKKYFVLYFGQNGEEDVFITQQDIREVQLAKGAISAGINIMLKQTDITVDELERVSIAGAFGSYISKNSAINIGLLPKIPEEKIVSIGNSAGVGAAMLLLSSDIRKNADDAAGSIKHIELATMPDFQMQYMASMKF